MSTIALLVYVHLLLMVFWIGTDIGVFIAGLRFMDSRRPVAERAAVIDLGMVIDRYPRVCYVAIFPVGLQLAHSLGVMPALSARWVALGWGLGGIWLVAVIAAMTQHGRPAARRWQRVERVFQVAAILVFGGLAAAVWLGRLEAPGWLAGKFLAYAAISVAAILLERAFGPVAATFGEIATVGSTAEREAALRAQMVRSYAWVLAIYAGVLVCGFLGTVKP